MTDEKIFSTVYIDADPDINWDDIERKKLTKKLAGAATYLAAFGLTAIAVANMSPIHWTGPEQQKIAFALRTGLKIFFVAAATTIKTVIEKNESGPLIHKIIRNESLALIGTAIGDPNNTLDEALGASNRGLMLSDGTINTALFMTGFFLHQFSQVAKRREKG